MFSPPVRRRLEVLGYPHSHENVVSVFEGVVVWLEDTKIRVLPPKERKGLKEGDNKTEWMRTFYQYLKKLDIDTNTLPPPSLLTIESEDFREHLVDRLTTIGILEMYLDEEQDEIVKDKGDLRGGDLGESNVPLISKGDVIDPRLLEQLNGCLAEFQLPLLTCDSTWDEAGSAVKCIRDRCKPAEPLATGKSAHLTAYRDRTNMKMQDDLRNLDVLLRVLHGGEQKKIQGHINRIVASLQTLTGEARTNTGAGRVGR
eukprot:GHVO01017885.1.p1 GENE.GHVO01017885.1~~GHVO01017885.1.p1  ORF type:complete len:264 (-),score=62.47 GHVO01017885.1:365-1135(-)